MTRSRKGRMPALSVVMIVTLVLWSALYATSADARRIALVIGNGNYTSFGDLHNPVNDAKAMADKLRTLDFTLIGDQAHVDVSRQNMARLLGNLEDDLARAQSSGVETTALVYYSGHGVAVDNQNWLVPVDDGHIKYREDVPKFAIGTTDSVMRSMDSAGARVHILILDACRNNNLPSRYGTRSSLSKGLSRIQPSERVQADYGDEAQKMIVYAAAPGMVAYDGRKGDLSPFTKALINEIGKPRTRIIDVMSAVRRKVMLQTTGLPDGKQVPWVNHSMHEPFCFVPPCGRYRHDDDDDDDDIIIWRDQERRRECEACPLMVAVPAGKFKMGSDKYKTELPVRQVNIRRFAVGIHEVTFSQWDACHRAGRCSYNPLDNRWGRGNRPVIDVSWNDAQEYVRWLSEETGAKYRLLSESEWEYVARAGTTGPFHTGSTILRDQANYGGSGTLEVGSRLESNRFGLHDVHGNVWEWVEDCWHGNYLGAPQDGRAWTKGGDCGKRVFRGGSWENPQEFVSSSYRWGGDDRLRATSLGFRVARDLN